MTSVEARPPGISLESIIIHDGPSYVVVNLETLASGEKPSNNLIQTFCSTKTSWSSANDKNVNIAITVVSVLVLVAFLKWKL